MRSVLQPIAQDALQRQVAPGVVVLASDRGEIRCHEAFGHSADEVDSGWPTRPDAIFDAASVTKAAVTSCLMMTLVAEGKIALESRVAPLLDELSGAGKDQIEVRHLLGHASGLPAHQLFYERIRAGDLAGAVNARDALVKMAGQTPLAYETGSQTVYSDLGYILLARLIERVSGRRLDQLFAERIGEPLGMVDSGFVDLLEGGPHPQKPRVMPTRSLVDQSLLCAEVHDDNAHAGGGICGHAGLFTTAGDLARLAQTLCDAYRGDSSFLPAEVLRSFWTTKAAPKTSWRMGWDTPSSEPGVSHSGDTWPQSGVGHLGFTGTAWWLAPEQQRFVIILTNRVYYPHDKSGIKALRRALMHAIAETLPAL